jgi:hypothetical protein
MFSVRLIAFFKSVGKDRLFKKFIKNLIFHFEPGLFVLAILKRQSFPAYFVDAQIKHKALSFGQLQDSGFVPDDQ